MYLSKIVLLLEKDEQSLPRNFIANNDLIPLFLCGIGLWHFFKIGNSTFAEMFELTS
jgi:hypothetical protein